MGNYTVSPSSDGVRPAMKQMYNGRNVATRPIPLIVDSSEIRAINAAAADQEPKAYAVNMPSGPRPVGADQVFGTRVAGAPGNAVTDRAAVFNPLTGTANFE